MARSLFAWLSVVNRPPPANSSASLGPIRVSRGLRQRSGGARGQLPGTSPKRIQTFSAQFHVRRSELERLPPHVVEVAVVPTRLHEAWLRVPVRNHQDVASLVRQHMAQKGLLPAGFTGYRAQSIIQNRRFGVSFAEGKRVSKGRRAGLTVGGTSAPSRQSLWR